MSIKLILRFGHRLQYFQLNPQHQPNRALTQPAPAHRVLDPPKPPARPSPPPRLAVWPSSLIPAHQAPTSANLDDCPPISPARPHTTRIYASPSTTSVSSPQTPMAVHSNLPASHTFAHTQGIFASALLSTRPTPPSSSARHRRSIRLNPSPTDIRGV